MEATKFGFDAYMQFFIYTLSKSRINILEILIHFRRLNSNSKTMRQILPTANIVLHYFFKKKKDHTLPDKKKYKAEQIYFSICHCHSIKTQTNKNV